MNITNDQMLSAGYCKSPNNIHSLPGNEWYAMSAGIPTVNYNMEIRLVDGELSVWTTKMYQRPNSRSMFCISGIIECIPSIDELKTWCAINGRLSERGLPAGIWGWD